MASLTPPPHAEKSSSGYVWLDEDGVIIAVAESHDIHTLQHAIENTEINKKVSGGTPRPFLIDMNRVKTMSREARAYYAGPEPLQAVTAVAILTNSAVGKMVANFFLSLTKPKVPTMLFTDFSEAKKWLLQYKILPEQQSFSNEHA